MVITYGTRTLFKREGAWGHAICKNCGHDAPQTLCRQLDQVTLFFIPIVSLEKQRGILCESCGMIVPVSYTHLDVYKRQLLHAPSFTGIQPDSGKPGIFQTLLLHPPSAGRRSF